MSNFTESSEDLQAQNSMIIDQLNEIKDDIKSKQPLISQPSSFYKLKTDYVDSDPAFLDGISYLENNYESIALVRGDGNCFYRGFIFCYAYNILLHFLSKNPDYVQLANKEIDQFKTKLNFSMNFLVNTGHSEDIIGQFYEEIVALFDSLTNLSSVQDLIRLFFESKDNSPSPSDSMCCYLRILTSGELKSNSNEYWPFLDTEHANMDQYCLNEVDPIDKEVDNIHITALINFFFMKFRILYLDRNCSEFNVPALDLIAEDRQIMHNGVKFEPNHISFTLLYRPGHYDALFSKI